MPPRTRPAAPTASGPAPPAALSSCSPPGSPRWPPASPRSVSRFPLPRRPRTMSDGNLFDAVVRKTVDLRSPARGLRLHDHLQAGVLLRTARLGRHPGRRVHQPTGLLPVDGGDLRSVRLSPVAEHRGEGGGPHRRGHRRRRKSRGTSEQEGWVPDLSASTTSMTAVAYRPRF